MMSFGKMLSLGAGMAAVLGMAVAIKAEWKYEAVIVILSVIVLQLWGLSKAVENNGWNIEFLECFRVYSLRQFSCINVHFAQ